MQCRLYQPFACSISATSVWCQQPSFFKFYSLPLNWNSSGHCYDIFWVSH